MSTIEQDFNFNNPVEVVEIFRTTQDAGKPPIEYQSKCSFVWEDVAQVAEYPYPDDWQQLKGEKFYIKLHSDPQSKIILGSYKDMISYWTLFRNAYPLWVLRGEEDKE